MAHKLGRFSAADLKKLQKRLEKLQKDELDIFCRKLAKEIAARLLRLVIERTPTGDVPSYATEEAKAQYWSGYIGGTLQRGWTASEIVRQGDEYRITVYNPVEYASYVEYGHRQSPGRYVPQLSKQLKELWSPGKFMMTISVQEVESITPALLQKRLYEKLKGVF